MMSLPLRAATLGLCFIFVAAGRASGDEQLVAIGYLQSWKAQARAPGVSACVAVRGHIVFSHGLGISDLQSGMPQNGRSVHNIGSISKTQALVAVLQLTQQGKVRLDAEIQAYAPWFPRKSYPITVRQILTHTSGVRHYKDGEFGPAEVLSFRQYDDFEQSTRFWRDDSLLFEPGTHWLYSSYATNLMQPIVETVSGEGLERYLRQHVWLPAGMTATQFDVPARVVPRRGRGYERDTDSGELRHAVDENVSYKYAGGGMISTDEDLCRFGAALNAGKLLDPSAVAEMYRVQLPSDITRLELPIDPADHDIGSRQGLIFRMDRDSAQRPYASHPGSVKGTESYFLNYYQDDVVVALHVNVGGAGALDLGRAAQSLAVLYLPAGSEGRTAGQ